MSNTLNLQDIAVSQIKPNSYNFNRMTDAALKELTREVKARGYVIHHLVVRPAGGEFVILDGEHQWRAATAAGLATVPCQVVEADDYDARRETYRRNLLRGNADPLAVGRMIVDMKAFAQQTGRAGKGKGETGSNVHIAHDLGVSEATVRNYLLYVDAAARCGEEAWPSEDAIAKMGVRELKELLAGENVPTQAQAEGEATEGSPVEDEATAAVKAVERIKKALGKLDAEQRREIKKALDKMVRADNKAGNTQLDIEDHIAQQAGE
jgi:ParB family chromosome partitioning protein